MLYPADWNEFEDGEGSFLFYNPSEWTGNFRISAYKGNAMYGREVTRQELKDNPSAVSVKIGSLACAYSKEMFEEEGAIILLIFGLQVWMMLPLNVPLR